LLKKGKREIFYPNYLDFLEKNTDIEIFVEEGYGARMGFSHNDYLKQNPNIKFSSHYEIYRKNMVL
jgi:alanine dehydrogenase